MPSPLVWLITGTSSGLGRDFVLAALKRGDKVIATARGQSVEKLDDLKAQGADILELDVTAPLSDLQAIAAKAITIYGTIDVLVNNAGYVEFGSIEESTPEETQSQYNTNVFGLLNVTRAFLPHLRERRTGTIVFIGSMAGWYGSPGMGLYTSTKHAVRALAESLAKEVAPFGIKVLNIEPGYFRTPILQPGRFTKYEARVPAYQPIVGPENDFQIAASGKQAGDPVRAAQVLMELVHGDGAVKGKKIPVTIGLGSDYYEEVKAFAARTLKRVEDWGEISKSTDFPKDA
ncbi:short chain dehydrogenase [Peniophora sp. CONT]|nr:short chain dehydrogenase [Peniophora sp. CONT]